ncbi:hypothetical protein Bbelb_018730 [Branchiostoma belcheri]|nr:hypothetical protein Bbelb_018730 [Branchiostoma belcheri]
MQTWIVMWTAYPITSRTSQRPPQERQVQVSHLSVVVTTTKLRTVPRMPMRGWYSNNGGHFRPSRRHWRRNLSRERLERINGDSDGAVVAAFWVMVTLAPFGQIDQLMTFYKKGTFWHLKINSITHKYGASDDNMNISLAEGTSATHHPLHLAAHVVHLDVKPHEGLVKYHIDVDARTSAGRQGAGRTTFCHTVSESEKAPVLEDLRKEHTYQMGMLEVLHHCSIIYRCNGVNTLELGDYLVEFTNEVDPRTIVTLPLMVQPAEAHLHDQAQKRNEKRNVKPYAVPVRVLPIRVVKDEEMRRLYGFVTDGEWNSLRTMGGDGPVSIIQLMIEAKAQARTMTAGSTRRYLTLSRASRPGVSLGPHPGLLRKRSSVSPWSLTVYGRIGLATQLRKMIAKSKNINANPDPNPGVVVSPLNSLMMDQAQRWSRMGVPSAAVIIDMSKETA